MKGQTVINMGLFVGLVSMGFLLIGQIPGADVSKGFLHQQSKTETYIENSNLYSVSFQEEITSNTEYDVIVRNPETNNESVRVIYHSVSTDNVASIEVFRDNLTKPNNNFLAEARNYRSNTDNTTEFNAYTGINLFDDSTAERFNGGAFTDGEKGNAVASTLAEKNDLFVEVEPGYSYAIKITSGGNTMNLIGSVSVAENY
jgi:hypothetical protein